MSKLREAIFKEGLFARIANAEINKNVPKEKTDDTKIRMQIHKIIREGIASGKTDEEIKKEIYEDKLNEKYFDFIEQWLNNQRKKVEGKEER